jgi:hypothetical protein
MTFLKWYTFVWELLSIVVSLYTFGTKNDLVSFLATLIIKIPVLIYIFLS